MAGIGGKELATKYNSCPFRPFRILERHINAMIPLRTRHPLVPIFVLSLAFLNVGVTPAASMKSQVIARELLSKNIAHNKIGVDPTRKILVYLPAGYDEPSSQRYPVIYFLPNPFEESYRYDFDHRDAQDVSARLRCQKLRSRHNAQFCDDH